ncbi:MAG: hypothetical protein KGV46_02670 [Pasteurella sp.]|nr:hypothetical protein [Pasteurella sp.]
MNIYTILGYKAAQEEGAFLGKLIYYLIISFFLFSVIMVLFGWLFLDKDMNMREWVSKGIPWFWTLSYQRYTLYALQIWTAISVPITVLAYMADDENYERNISLLLKGLFITVGWLIFAGIRVYKNDLFADSFNYTPILFDKILWVLMSLCYGTGILSMFFVSISDYIGIDISSYSMFKILLIGFSIIIFLWVFISVMCLIYFAI